MAVYGYFTPVNMLLMKEVKGYVISYFF